MRGKHWTVIPALVLMLSGWVPAQTGAERVWRSYFVPQAGRAYHSVIPFQYDNASVLMIGGYGFPGIIDIPSASPAVEDGGGFVGYDAWTSLNGSQWFRAGLPDSASSRINANLVELNSRLYFIGGIGEDAYSTGQVWTSTDGLS